MPQRTTIAQVQARLQTDYDGKTDLQPSIDMATVMVDRTVGLALSRGVALLASEQELIERNLAAHYYVRSDRVYTNKTTAGASAGFVLPGPPDDIQEPYLKNAIEVDYSGALRLIILRRFASGFWAGKPPSQQIPVDQRD